MEGKRQEIGRGQGRHRRGRRRRVMRFLQPCLLLLLRTGNAHGYGLLAELERFGFDKERVDPTLVYRALREMEQAGWVRSKQDDRSQGPPRRVLSLTVEGERQLAAWTDDLRQTRAEIDRLLEAYGDAPMAGNQ